MAGVISALQASSSSTERGSRSPPGISAMSLAVASSTCATTQMSAMGLPPPLALLWVVRLSRASAMHWGNERLSPESWEFFLSWSYIRAASARRRLPMRRPVTVSNSPRRCTIPSSPSQTRTQRRARWRACSDSPPSSSRSVTQRRASRANCSGRIDSAFASNSESEPTSEALVRSRAAASCLALVADTRPSATASNASGTSRSASAVLTWLWASRRDSPVEAASTSAPPSP